MSELNSDLVTRFLVSSKGNIPLAAERLSTAIGRTVTDYEIYEHVTDNSNTSKGIADKLRTILMVDMFDIIVQLQGQLLVSLDELRPHEIARAHAALVQAFSSLSAPGAKAVFDIDMEAERAAKEFGIEDVSEIKAELKTLLARNRAASKA